jgi:hypothetical protein
MATHSFLIRCPLPHRRWNRELCDSRQPASLLSAAQTSKQVGCAVTTHECNQYAKAFKSLPELLSLRRGALADHIIPIRG